MTLNQWLLTVESAVARYSVPLTEAEKQALLAPFGADDALSELCNRILKPVMREIFARGRDGETFGDPRRLENDILYGTVESAFEGASQTFLNVTRSFLTFWKEYTDIAHLEPRVALQGLLLGFINEYKKRFFPAAGIRKPIPYVFASEQREVLDAFGDGIDIEDFFRGNPLFIDPAHPMKGTGCLLTVVCASLGGFSFFAWWYLFAHVAGY